MDLQEIMSSNDDVMKAIRDLSLKFDSLQEDVNVLKKNEPPRSKVAANTPRTRSWADRMEQQDPEDQVDYGEQITWGDVDNATWHNTRRGFIVPDSPAVRTPRLDSVLKADALQQTKALDKELAKVQTFVLDAAGPLTQVLEAANSEEGLSTEVAIEAARAALMLVGNANARMSRQRRQRVLAEFNKSLQPMADKDEEFSSATPYLFGPDFAKRAKEHMDQVKSLQAARKDPTGAGSSSFKAFFRQRPSGNRGGNHKFYRGGTSQRRGRSHLYQQNQHRRGAGSGGFRLNQNRN